MASVIQVTRAHLWQPLYPVKIDPLWANKIAFLSISGLHGGRDLVSGQLPAISGTVASRPTQKGIASYTGSVSSGLVWSTLTPISNIFNTGMAFLMIANPAAQATQQRAFFFGNELPAVSNQYNQAQLAFNSDRTGTNSSGLFTAFEYNFGFQARAQSAAGMVDGNWHVFIANRPPAFGTWALYRDGINVTGTADSANGVPLTSGARVHCHPQNTAGYSGNAVLNVAFNSTLDARQLAELSINPWRVLKAEPRRIWIGAAGATTHDLAAAASSQVNTVTAPAITQAQELSAAPSVQVNTVTAPAITQAQELSAAASAQVNTVTAPAITQAHELSAAASVQVNTVTAGAVTQAQGLSPAASAQVNTATAPAITQAHELSAAPSVQVNTGSAPEMSLGVVVYLEAAISAQVNTVTAGAITQAHSLVAAPSIQDNIAAASALVQMHILAAAASVQINRATAGAITIPGAIVTIDAPAGVGPRLRSKNGNRPASLSRTRPRQ